MSTPCGILIVEDESVISMDMERTLERLGYAITGSAASGQEALDGVRSFKPDLVLMDIQLQGNMDGLTTAELINQEFDVPIVFVTANANDETVARSRQTGTYGFLNKPFRASELKATIEIALHQHRVGRKLSAEKELLQERMQQTSEALGQTKEELQALSRHLMRVQEDERRRIARELHDDLGQQVALLGMQADRLGRELPAEQRTRAAALLFGLNTLAHGLREVSHKLHPPIIADLGLTEAVKSLVNDFRSQGLSIKASVAKVEEISLDVSTAVYRIAQESLQNVHKHAPAAAVRVTLTASRAELNLRIADDGDSFSLAEVRRRGGLGLISMQERARLVGGSLMLNAQPRKGTTVLVRIPIQASSAADAAFPSEYPA